MTVSLDEITRHIERNIGPIHIVFHEIVSDEFHIDVHPVKSTFFRRYEVLVTSGMSARPMKVPHDQQNQRLAEMLVVLPRGWPLNHTDFADEKNYWPLRLIKTLARFPHQAETWLGYGHTVANGDAEGGAQPYAEDTALCATAILPSSTLGESAWRLHTKNGEDVLFWAAVPLYWAELQFKMQHGIDPLLDLFDKHNITDRIERDRACVVPSNA
jgi:hypothetical protein